MRPRRSTVVLARRTCGSFGLRVLDHIVVGHGTERWVSLKDRGVL